MKQEPRDFSRGRFRENKIKNLELKLETIQKKVGNSGDKIYYSMIQGFYPNNNQQIESETTIFGKSGKGILQYFLGTIIMENFSNSDTSTANVQFIVDDKILLNLDIYPTNFSKSLSRIYLRFYTNTNLKQSRNGGTNDALAYVFLKPSSTEQKHNFKIDDILPPFALGTYNDVQIFEQTSTLQRISQYKTSVENDSMETRALLINDGILDFSKNLKLTITPKSNGTIKLQNFRMFYKFTN